MDNTFKVCKDEDEEKEILKSGNLVLVDKKEKLLQDILNTLQRIEAILIERRKDS